MFGYKRAAQAVLALDTQLTDLVAHDGTLPGIAGIGPGSARVIHEVLDTGAAPRVEHAINASGVRAEVERRRALRQQFLSGAEVVRILRDPDAGGPRPGQVLRDLQMHSEWSDGSATLAELATACQGRSYAYAAKTEHSYGLKIAGGSRLLGPSR